MNKKLDDLNVANLPHLNCIFKLAFKKEDREMYKGKCWISGFISMILIVILIGGSMIPAFAQENEQSIPVIYTFSGGTGTQQDPYLISSVRDLLALSESRWNGDYMESSYRLTANIDLGDNTWVPIGSTGPTFSGTFDGNGKKITLRKIADGSQMGLFDNTERSSIIKNLTVNGQIVNSISASGDIYFGLILARGEGRIENCIAEGRVDLTVDGSGEFYFGGVAGKFNGSIDYIMNKAVLTMNRSGGGGKLFMGGITGAAMGKDGRLFCLTNQGNITAIGDGPGNIGGLAGLCGFGTKAENLLNLGNITFKQTATANSNLSCAGGILGELRDSDMDKALNKGNIYFEYSGPYVNEEIMAGGVAGLSEMAILKNVGNEGNVETKAAKIQHAIGITKPGRETKIENAYSKGKIYGSTTQTRGEIYAMGLGEKVVTNNFYFGGTVSLKAGKMQEISGEALANVRRGDKTNIYNYCYWNSSMIPFPGYPTFNKPTATSKAMNISTGKLSAPVSIGGKQYGNLSQALNAWVGMQNEGYLRWTAAPQPVFDWTFGYQIPDYMKYPNKRESKWVNTSDWAYEWMDKADRLDIIPHILLNQDMTKSISRKEFSALAVELYENLKGSKVSVDIESPFTDIDDPAVTMSYSLGIVAGIGNGLFAPDQSLTREQAATMLTRVYKAVYWDGWTLEEDGIYDCYVLDTAGVAKFSDDAFISGYAKDSVYFMAKNNIIAGIGNNIFGPAPIAGKNINYGKATREQAFKIAVVMIERFK